MKNYKYLVIFFFLVLLIGINISLLSYVKSVKNNNLDFLYTISKKEAQSVFDNIVATSQWNGDFIKKNIKKDNPPTQHLLLNGSKTVIPSKPTWMSKEFSNVNSRFNITSLHPNNPDNLPSDFEKEALLHFEKNANEKYYTKIQKDFSDFKFMGVLKANESCLACHQQQNYSVGDVIGGISIQLPIEEYKEQYKEIVANNKEITSTILIISLSLLFGIGYLINVFFSRSEQIEQNMHELQLLDEANETLNKRYKYAVEGSQSGIWDWNLLTDEVYFDKNWKAMLGYAEDELKNHLAEWDVRVHPDDKEKAIQDITDNHKKRTDFYLNVHRLRHKNGSWVWILDRGKTYFDDEGNAVRMVGFHTDITAFKELEMQLHEKEQNLMAAQTLAHMGHWRYNAVNNYFVVSNALYELLNLPKDIQLNSYEDFKEYIHEDDLEDFMFKHKTVFISKSKTDLEYRMRKYASNEIIYISEHISYVYNNQLNEESYIGTMQDVTEFKKTQKELQLFKQIIDTTPISIVITDKHANIMYVNKYFTKISGYTSDEVMGKNPRVLKSMNTSSEEYQELWDTLMRKETWGGIFKNVSKTQEEYWETALIVPVTDEKGEIINFLGIKREITKEVYLEKELKEKEELMLIQSKNAAMGEMISMIAHQWRQPITTISMMANNILADIELEVFEENTAKEFAVELSKQTQYLSKTIEDFRNFFKQDKQAEDSSMKEIFDNVESIISASLKNNNIELKLTYDNQMVIHTYIRELLQVLINLLKNAKEAFDAKPTENRWITIDVQEQEQMVIITVCDNAGGIAQEHLDKIFEAYYTTKEEHNGTGLGLYMSKMIAQKHLKGDLLVNNTDEGVCFTLSLQKSIQ